MANPIKAGHYDNELYSALTRGAWADGSPAKAVNGTPISWSELFRKYRKHNVRQHSTSQHIFTELAAQNQTLSILLLPPKVNVRNIQQEDMDGDGVPNSDTLELGDECLLSEERIEDGRLGFAAIKLLNDTPQDRDSIRLTRAYFAYALGQFQDCISLIEQAKCMRVTTETLASGNEEFTSVQRSTTTESTTNAGSVNTIGSDMKGANIWPVIEQIRGRCLQGMAHEKLKNPTEALASYEFALPLLDELSVPPPNSTLLTDPSFMKHRELWRWTERLLWRVSVLASKHSSIHTALTYLRKYNSFTLYYPASFRAGHRGVLIVLHLKALVNITGEGKPKMSWVTEARTLVEEYRVVLAVCTNFPKAGDRNRKVEEYCDGLVAVWERIGSDGMDSRWVIDILWWASRMTFHSHRIFRHLTRVLHAAGENDLALRCFRLYIQLVTKTRQTHLEEIEATVRRGRTLHLEDADVDGPNFTEERPDPTRETSQGSDHDRHFVEFLVFGCRMVCRLPGTPEDARWAVEQLEMANNITIKNAKLSSDRRLRARLACAAGVADAILAHREADPNTRPLRMRSALDHFQSAVQLDTESADIYFHLAIALLRAGPVRDIDGAVGAAKHAVELEPTEVRYWHLLGLALSANGENMQAREVLVIGEGMEQTEDCDTPADATGTETPKATFAVLSVRTESPSAVDSLLPVSATRVPVPTTMLLPLPDHPPPSKHERFEHGLQLRMTLMAIVELMDGRDSAAQKWVDVFAWFAERGGWVVHQDETRRDSFDLPPIDPLPPSLTDESVTDNERPHRPPQLTLTRSLSSDDGGDGMPITLIPPTPRESGDAESVHTLRLSNDKECEPEVSKRKKAQQKAQRIIKEQVEKRQSQIQTISRKLGRSGTMRSNLSRVSRHSSTPDFNVLLAESRLYQASSIHSRPRVISPRGSYIGPHAPSSTSTPPPPGPTVPPSVRTPRERRLLSDLWLMSAATFRRMEKYDEARAAIQDAEKHDAENEGVWVQLGLYFSALDDNARAIAAFHKALVISPDYIPAIVHLSEQYLHPSAGQSFSLVKDASEARRGAVDLAAGMLSSFTKGVGWDVPEAWYLLAKAVGMQGRKERQRVCLTYALGLVEGQPMRDLQVALGYAL